MTETVFVIDDEAVRCSLQALLEAQGYAVTAHASAEDFLAAYRSYGKSYGRPYGRAACALVDLRMPGMDGLALLDRLARDNVHLPVVVVTGHGDVPLAVKAMKAGAVDFIEKPYSNESILGVVRQAIERGRREEVDDAALAETSARLATLTPRERDVLEQLVLGRPNKIIAHELRISPRTVEIHRANLMKKMQADSLSHLVRMALSAGLGPKG
jgi:two-component system, LuxR family, response regulator FixJ